jgi:hypothetical protein
LVLPALRPELVDVEVEVSIVQGVRDVEAVG